ncbi:MAG: flagellar biosynthetic protein FliR [Candidatus Eremiobacteraeota bacterium]|nr:flagellar biosynthetic protein FliR [Candidatus Eremiobacteraeota bacterium]
MIDVFGLSPAQVETFFLIFIRCSVIIAVMPIFGATQIPVMVRVALGLLISFVVYRTVPTMPLIGSLDQFAIAVVSQAVVGLLFAFVVQLVFMGIQFAGEILDIQIGFAVANIINPTTQQSVTIIGELQLALATLLFLVTDSHLLLFQGLGGSFNLLPLPWITLSSGAQASLILFFSQALLIVFKVAAPAAIAMFLVNVGLAFLSRVAPQMNIFVVGFPIQIAVGLFMLVLTLPLLGYALPGIFAQLPRQLDTMLRALRPV